MGHQYNVKTAWQRVIAAAQQVHGSQQVNIILLASDVPQRQRCAVVRCRNIDKRGARNNARDE